ncbi:ABC transporter ATP-binding protein [Brevibacterium gallinarum]|uniref:ABC transporter ATP-binding protein n=1 Tax=Brevibacterium gallinarum TaxID=2762220 RepID=A0ABR8WXS9_9MICO|nr:ABC transporter ATP-binding protein [Brevibacterium gallinarum]MBD8021718.1 ABC transporter ATP-binding protein [Brevibacterium gallinarum]
MKHTNSTQCTAGALTVEQVTVSVGRTILVRDVSFHAAPGEVTVLVGPNGSGKSTLLGGVFGARTFSGEIRLGGRRLTELSRLERVRRIGVLTQEQDAALGTRTREAVELGRTALQGPFGRLSADDDRHVAQAMEKAAVTHLAARDLATLSGGERQRTHLARVLAQHTELIIMDEPTNHLDIGHQRTILRLLTALARDEGRTVVVALHDLTAAAQFGDRVVLLAGGQVQETGRPRQVLTPEVIAAHFDVDAQWIEVAGAQRLIID